MHLIIEVPECPLREMIKKRIETCEERIDRRVWGPNYHNEERKIAQDEARIEMCELVLDEIDRLGCPKCLKAGNEEAQNETDN